MLGYLVLAIQSSQKLVVRTPQSAQDLRKISLLSLHANIWQGTPPLPINGCFICLALPGRGSRRYHTATRWNFFNGKAAQLLLPAAVASMYYDPLFS